MQKTTFPLFILLLYRLTVPVYAHGQPESGGLSAAEKNKLESLMHAMTLGEKIGQLSLFTQGFEMTGPAGTFNLRQLIREGKAGGVFNAVGVDSIRAIQRIAVEESRLKIPLLFGLDVIHGYRTIYPIPLAQACTWDLPLIEQIERAAASEASAAGLNWTFAPMVDLARDPRWGRVAEGSGEDTWLGCRIAEARVKGFQGSGLRLANTLMACVKHYAAYGAAQAGRDYHTVDLSPVSLYEWYLPPYRAAVDAGAGSVMSSFNEINGVPATGNRWLLTDVLRKEWGFEGFVVSDWTSVNEMMNHGVAADTAGVARLAISAGLDMDMMSGAYMGSLERLVLDHAVSVPVIDSAVRRVLEAKFRLGLFDDPYRRCDPSREKTEILSKEKRALARQSAAESCVLLKNEGNILPVPSTVRRIAVIGPLGNSGADMMGCWSGQGRAEECVTLLDGIRTRTGNGTEVTFTRGCSVKGTGRSGFDSAVAAAMAADFVVMALGESEDMSGEAASRASLGLPGLQEELAERIVQTGKPVVVVLFNGRPLVLTRLASVVPALLEAWQGGTEAGNGIADVLFGEVNPSGKLTMCFPRSEGQVPVFYNAKPTGRPMDPAHPDEKYVSRYLDEANDPLFPFGFGLSYTTFSYSEMTASVTGNRITVQVRVANTGARDGEEAVQLYVRDRIATITRPVKELRGFQKVFLKKGESERITFTLTSDDLAFYHPDLRKYCEPGEFVLFAGGSSAEGLSVEVKTE
ncbi:MAG TPA: beta-glucosidase BglX [Bacteroidales bacterium]|nr:beta-glucosidase BglX [Bacteroidales bacterium]